MTEIGEVIYLGNERRVVVARVPMWWKNEKGEERVLSYALLTEPVNQRSANHGSTAIERR
jgi:hypothetical protein